MLFFFFFQAEDGIRDLYVTGVQTCALPIFYKGVVKVMAKMGISTIKSYCGAQIFEAVGLGQELVDKYFTWTPSRVGGIGLEEIAREAGEQHAKAFPAYALNGHTLEVYGQYQYRKDGELH